MADVNSDGLLDIILGNKGRWNEVIKNKGLDVFIESYLPSGEENTLALALGDLNGDLVADIVTANFDSSNQLLTNIEDAVYTPLHLHVTGGWTYAIGLFSDFRQTEATL